MGAMQEMEVLLGTDEAVIVFFFGLEESFFESFAFSDDMNS